MMRTEKMILAAGATDTLSIAGKWFRVRKLVGGLDPYVTVKALSTHGNKQLADGLTAYDGDLYGWEEDSFRDLTFTNPTADDQTFEVIISDQGKHEVSRPAVAIVGAVSIVQACRIDDGEDRTINAGVTDTITPGVVGTDVKKITIQNDVGSAGDLRVGGDNVSDTNGFVLPPGGSKEFNTNNELGVLVVKVRNPTGAPGACTYRMLVEDRGPS